MLLGILSTQKQIFKITIYIFIIYGFCAFIYLEDFHPFQFTPLTKKELYVQTLSRHSKNVIGPDGKTRRVIILAMLDASFVDMAVNLYETSFKKYSISHYLFMGTSRLACDELFTRQINCFHYTEDPNSNISSIYRSEQFIKKMNIRTDMIIEALEAGFTVLHTDLDVVFLKNPLPHIEELMFVYEIMLLWDYIAFNAGFLIINPTVFTLDIYQTVKNTTEESPVLPDQKALNNALRKYESNDKPSFDKRVHVLNREKYLCGKSYFQNKNLDFPPENGTKKCEECLVVHNNWIVSKEAKIYRFKEALMWRINDNGYYSNKSAKYLTYSNKFFSKSFNTAKVMEYEINALKTAFVLAYFLNRTVILPRFHCEGLNHTKECTLLNYLSIRDLDKFFPETYRENSFFKHDLIPNDLKVYKTFYQNYNYNASSNTPQIIVIKTKNNLNFIANTTKQVKVIDFNANEQADEKTLKKELAAINDKVIHFDSLIGVTVALSEQHKAFNESLKNAFVIRKYMQF